jgi:hypothetical protein
MFEKTFREKLNIFQFRYNFFGKSYEFGDSCITFALSLHKSRPVGKFLVTYIVDSSHTYLSVVMSTCLPDSHLSVGCDLPLDPELLYRTF